MRKGHSACDLISDPKVAGLIPAAPTNFLRSLETNLTLAHCKLLPSLTVGKKWCADQPLPARQNGPNLAGFHASRGSIDSNA